MSDKLLDQNIFNIDYVTDIDQFTDENLFNNDENNENEICVKNNFKPILDDNYSNLSIENISSEEEDIFNCLSLFNENILQFGDGLELENGLKSCSSINSNETTVSSQETSEFRECLLNANLVVNSICNNNFVDDSNFNRINDKQLNKSGINQINSTMLTNNLCTNISNQENVNYIANNSIANQTITTDVYKSSISATSPIYYGQDLFNDNFTSLTNNNDILNDMNSNEKNNFTNISLNNNYQINNQLNSNNDQIIQSANQSNSTNYYYKSQINNQNNLQLNIVNNNIDVNSNLIENNSLLNINSTNNNFLNFTECRDVNCSYTYCSRYNPYFNNDFVSFRNEQFKQSQFNENYLANTSVNLNVIDNQIIKSKQSDHIFDFNSNVKNLANQPKQKRTKKSKTEYIETVICNDTSDYTFYKIEENSQFKKKRGRKRKDILL